MRESGFQTDYRFSVIPSDTTVHLRYVANIHSRDWPQAKLFRDGNGDLYFPVHHPSRPISTDEVQNFQDYGPMNAAKILKWLNEMNEHYQFPNGDFEFGNRIIITPHIQNFWKFEEPDFPPDYPVPDSEFRQTAWAGILPGSLNPSPKDIREHPELDPRGFYWNRSAVTGYNFFREVKRVSQK